MYIDVEIALPVYHPFTYHVGERMAPLAVIGKRVLVPFGRRRVTGYIVDVKDHTDQRETKAILDVLDEKPLFPPVMIPFFRWIADYYIYPMGEVIKTALPSGLNVYDYKTVGITAKGKDLSAIEQLTPLEAEILGRLKQGECRAKDFSRVLKKEVPLSIIYAMENCGWISQKQELRGGGAKPRRERYAKLPGSEITGTRLSPQRRRIIEVLKAHGDLSVKEIKRLAHTTSQLVSALEKSGHIEIYEKSVCRDPFGESIKPDTKRLLTDEQETVARQVLGSLGKGFTTYLLAGVTGSGKTEVYMQLAARVIEHGYSVLVLVPEIALIAQMERRFRARFGECVAVLHSGLSTGERYDQWLRILNKEASIAVGARSAVFAPFDNIGLIVVDEEHDTSYKQERGFRYHARDLALVRGKQGHSVVLLGSATPSMQSYHNAKRGKFVEVSMTRRVENQPLPEISVVDLSGSRDYRGIRRFMTPELQAAMGETLARDEQVLLFLNRRGFAGFPVCTDCGEAFKCKNCEITLTFHQKANAYKCHYCGFTRAARSNCSTCGSENVKLLGLGTEKVESAVKALFPQARVARMDRDTTRHKGALLRLLKAIRDHDVDVVVGTQMVAKGHDFPNITLVGVICADLSMNFPDFRAGERTFQLLAQVAGRAGRGTVAGKVVLQTFNPEHFSIEAAKEQDFRVFYEREIVFRKKLKYPPFSRMIQLQISGIDEENTRKLARVLGEACHHLRKSHKHYIQSIDVLGPIAAPLARIASHYRWQILLKGMRVRLLHQYIHRLMNDSEDLFNNRNVNVTVDVDPVFMM